jgi:hypothetical protein
MLTEHEPPTESVQVLETNVTVPGPPIWEKVMVSPVTGAVKPDRVAVQVEVTPTPKLVGTQDTARVVTILRLQITLVEPEPPA